MKKTFGMRLVKHMQRLGLLFAAVLFVFLIETEITSELKSGAQNIARIVTEFDIANIFGNKPEEDIQPSPIQEKPAEEVLGYGEEDMNFRIDEDMLEMINSQADPYIINNN